MPKPWASLNRRPGAADFSLGLRPRITPREKKRRHCAEIYPASSRPPQPFFSSQEWSHRGLESVSVLEADDLLAEYSFAVIEHCGGQSFDPAKLLLQLVG